jgi:hypothetical protein
VSDIAFLLGGSFELALDPLDIVFGLIIGAAASRWWQRLVAAALLALLVTMGVRLMSDFAGEMPVAFVAITRTVAIFAWACVGWLLRLASKRFSRA